MLTIVTWNHKKYQQIAWALPAGVEVCQRDLDIPETQTNLITDISYDKCLQAYVEVQWPILVDDSGIYFDAYNKFPGALTKYLYQWVWLEGIQRLYTDVEDMRARFQCVLSYMDSTLPEPVQFVGEVEGRLDFSHIQQAEDAKLPYDLIFVPDGMDEPVYFDMQSRNDEYNHRVRATRKFVSWYWQKI